MATESPLVRRLLWNLLPLALVVWAVTTTLIGHDGLLERHAVKQALYARRDQVARLDAENDQLRSQIRALRTSPQVIRRAAAEQLLAAEPGSTIYRFAPPASPAP